MSVCVPTRDRERWLGEALASVLAQTCGDFELIVGDDASRDGTRELVAAIGDRRVRYLRHRRPLGVARNRNACLAAARGDLVAWLDSDDRWQPGFLAAQSAFLERHADVVLVHGGCEVIGEDGRLLPPWPPPFAADTVLAGQAAFAELVLRNHVAAPTALVRRTAHQRVGPYRAALRSGEDWDMWLRLALHGDVAYTAEPLAQYRWHAGSLTRSAAASGAQLRRDLRVVRGVFARHGDRVTDRPAVERRARAALAARAVQQGTDRLTRGRRLAALASLLVGVRALPALARRGALWRLIAAAATADEYRWHLASRALLAELATELAGTGLGERLRAVATPQPGWEETLREVARAVRAVVPERAAIAVVDKWDPTVLHLAGRRGWHFPDRRVLPDGYPAEAAVALRHLDELRRRGARFLVLPSSAFWWLETYPQLATYLARTGERVWSDEHCVIHRLAAPDRRRGSARREPARGPGRSPLRPAYAGGSG